MYFQKICTYPESLEDYLFCDMFYIGNNDVFLDGDLGIKKSKLNFFKSEEYQAEEYSPYRTFLCLYLWQSLNS